MQTKPKAFIKTELKTRIQKFPRLLELALEHPHLSRTIQLFENHVRQGTLEREDAIMASGGMWQTMVQDAIARHPDLPLEVLNNPNKRKTLHGILGYDPFPKALYISLEHPDGKHTIEITSTWDARRIVITPKKEE